jgi:NAD(P)-dependent dehydrogenase (short-subunit alcohol dehydrogenase family)
MSKWTAADIPDQTGKWAIITGANSGIGFSAARELARKKCAVVLACRNAAKGQTAKERIEKEIPGAVVEVGSLDLANLQSVRDFARQIIDRGKPFDVLVNNAAVMAMPARQTTSDGFESQFGTNHLGHFALTGLLLPALLSAKAARVVTVASIAHLEGKIHFDDLQLERSYSPWAAYRQSKLANLLFALELERRFRRDGSSAISIAVHPGLSKTQIIKNGPGTKGGIRAAVMEATFAIFAQSADRGALPTLFAATASEARGGKYYGPDGWFEWRGYPVEAKVSEAARDELAAAKLWEISERLTGVKYGAGREKPG